MFAQTKNADNKRAVLLFGGPVASQIKQEVAEDVAQIRAEHGVIPLLAAVRVGDDPASALYVKSKMKACAELGINSEHIERPSSISADELLSIVSELNARDDVDGILVQLPLPAQIDERSVIESIMPQKDVDGFHPINVGKLALGQPSLVPCTPLGIVELLNRSGIGLSGSHACIVGRSKIVGRPLAQLLLQNDATVTICHSRTKNLEEITQRADILVAAIGRPGFIGKSHIRPGATVVDVGINRISDPDQAEKLFGDDLEARLETIKRRGYTVVGDVNPAEADVVAGARTPVPGGVGLLTVAMLMRNTVQACRSRRDLAW